MDAFAVCISAASTGMISDKRAVFRLSFHFGLFQFMMPVIGWFIGLNILTYIAFIDHWIAFGLLAYVGIKMIQESLSEKEDIQRANPSKGMNLVMLSVATSIDALAVGLSIGILDIEIWYPSFMIGVITAGLSLVGIQIGQKLGKRFGKRMELIGGVILIIIGTRILFTHLFFQ
ncbi:MAG: manganese efflux pump MntP family protein [Calditrichaceae bacterium]